MWHNRTGAILLLIITALALLVFLSAGASAEEAQGDDGWRRTAYGWEHIDSWRVTSVWRGGVSDNYVPPPPGSNQVPFNVHPGWLALMQVVVVGAAMRVACTARERDTREQAATFDRASGFSFAGR